MAGATVMVGGEVLDAESAEDVAAGGEEVEGVEEGIHQHVLIELAFTHLAAGAFEGSGVFGIKSPSELDVGEETGQLDGAISPDELRMDRPAGEGEVFESADGMDAIEDALGDEPFSQQVSFETEPRGRIMVIMFHQTNRGDS
jgi:hypothetical protein